MAKLIDCNNDYQKEILKEAALALKNGKLVLFPTETVYGIGANGLDAKAVNSIFIAKGRAQDNPLILHVANKEMIDMIAKDISTLERKLIDIFFPGPLTIILKKKDIVPNNVTGGLDTVGIRMPSNQIALDLISLANVPIAAPSANISGKPSGTKISDIYYELNDKVDYMIDGGKTNIGVESTVIKVENDTIYILRPGKITKEDLIKVTPNVLVDNHVLHNIKLNENDKIMSPGMKYRHYAPNSKCLLIYAKNNQDFIDKVNEIKAKYNNVIVLCRTNNIKYFNNAIDMGETKEEVANNIFTLLRKVDDYKSDLVIIEGVDKSGLGLAIMNRLLRACSYNYIEL